MQNKKANDRDGLIVRNSRRLAWKRIVFALGCIVVFCTTYALILPAITMEVPTFCGFEEHIHTDECYRQITSEEKISPIPVEVNPIIHHHTETCYNELGVLICGEADFVVHSHDENCYDKGGNLWCPLPEISLHIHDESCNIPQDNVNETHIHTDECYELHKKLICGFDTPETDIFGSEIVGGIAGEPTLNTGDSFFPAPPADDFASGEVTTIADTEATAEPALPVLSEPVTDSAAEAVSEPVVSEPIAEPAVTEPFSEAVQTDIPISDIMQNEAITAASTDDLGFGDILPGLNGTDGEADAASPVHQHTDDCYIYEKVLICTKAEAGGIMNMGGYALDLATTSAENYGFAENQEDPTAAIGLEEPNNPDESGITDLIGTYDESIVTDVPDNIDEMSNSDETVISGEINDTSELGNPEELVNQNNVPELVICPLPEAILHEHSFICYNESGELICGMPAVRIHQHTQECEGICYITEEIPIDQTALTCELFEGEGAHLHSFEYGCFDENMNIICPLEESLGHFHDIHCYGKWELICGMEEHDHTEECEIDPDNVTLDNDIMMLANAADTWGYYPDGSIYWNRTYDLAPVPLDSIQDGMHYILRGPKKYTILTNEDYVMTPDYFDNKSMNHVYRKTEIAASVSDLSAYQYWCFKKADDIGNYYIYCSGNDGVEQYLYFGEYDIYTNWGQNAANLLLTSDINQASVFNITAVGNSVNISSTVNGERFYINAYWGDGINTTCWWGHTDPCDIQICIPTSTVREDAAHRLPTVSSSNTVINLFDYWIASDGPEGQFMWDSDGDHPNGGINKNHNYHFVRDGEEGNSLNRWTGSDAPKSGIVNNVLGYDGYPQLSGNHQDDLNPDRKYESLAYLFDPDFSHIGKASYTNVGGLLRNNDEGYFFFDCKQTMAEYNQEDNNIYIYDKPGVKEKEGDKGQFFPFNKAPQIMESVRDDSQINHYFGMTITTRFFQKNGGYTKQNSGIPTSFHFSGDDDVWIFIDDVLIGDGGGIHDACSIDIDFVTGEVLINGAHSTTLNLAFEAAGKAGTTKWSETQPATFADNTTHTLKFFYLERGNYSSNLELKYNLISIPKTAIYKVDQYGQVVPGAKFAVYAADANYNMLNAKDGYPVNAPENPQYDIYGNLTDGVNTIAHALYTGITNNQGEMIFEDTVNNVPLTLTEIRNMFGDHFILREIKVPDGYRVVSKDVHLEIWTGAEQTILRCRNTSESGSRAAPTLQVTATDIIWLKTAAGAEPITYYQINRDEANDHVTTQTYGTLFAVVMKYTGPVDFNGDPTALSSDSSWTPVYGNDMYGYQLVNVKDNDIISAAIEAAKKSQTEGNEVVFKVSPSCDMQVTLENLPGNIATYYRMLDEANKKNTRYTVGFYWTSKDSLYEATRDDTFGVYSHDDELVGITGAKGFERAFGANIKVPNLINKIFVQKTNENNTLINGATFAIYNVHQDETTGNILYRTSSGSYAELSTNYSIDSSTGVITDGSSTIIPIQTTTTSQLDSVHTGTGEFTNLDDGQYVVKEIKAPAGYKINTTDIMVLVTEDTIYANAGTESDGVIVGRGPGYVVNTLNLFASQGEIDNTLTWIYARMKISKPSNSFYDIGKPDMNKGYISKNESSETDGTDFRTYLVYKPSDAVTGGQVAFNYYPNKERHNGSDELAQYRRIFTTSGWPYYELWQDYEWGIAHKTEGANYEKWADEITNLFSRSTYIRVRDDEDSTLTVYKTNSDGNAQLSGAKFRLYRADSTGTKEYYSRNEITDEVVWVTDEGAAAVITTEENGHPEKGFTHLKNGTYYLEEISAPAGYVPLSNVVTVTIDLTGAEKVAATVPNGDNTVAKTLDVETAFEESSNVYTFTVTVKNTVGHELPQTGGCGTRAYTVAGISIITLAIALIIVKSRKAA